MTDDEVVAAAVGDGFELEERPVGGAWCWAWARGDDTRWPAFTTKGQAIEWMRQRLHRVAVFR